jgi:uncharacterized protein YjbI with pentapeptide repeats
MPAPADPNFVRRAGRLMSTHGAKLIVASLTIVGLGVLVGLVILAPLALVSWEGLTGQPALDAQQATRQTLIQAFGGFALLVGAMYTVRTFRLSSDRNVTDRLTQAVGQLGNDHVHVRLGGILALERIANESKRDYLPVVFLIASYVRDGRALDRLAPGSSYPPVAADIHAAMLVLGRRRHRELESDMLRLSAVDLSGLRLDRVDLSYTDFTYSRMTHSWIVYSDLRDCAFDFTDISNSGLTGSDCRESHFFRANVTGTFLKEADLRETSFERADMSRADLAARWTDGPRPVVRAARLEGASLSGTIMDGTAVEGVDLSRVQGLETPQLGSASFNDQTTLPPHIRRTDLVAVRSRSVP